MISYRNLVIRKKNWRTSTGKNAAALYDDDLKKALALLRRVKAVHAAAIRNGDAAVSALTSRLLYDIEKLEREI